MTSRTGVLKRRTPGLPITQEASILRTVADHIMMERLRAMASLLKPLRPLLERALLEIGAAIGSNVPYLMDLRFRLERILLNDACRRRSSRRGYRCAAG
jgi:hypothetical protein